MSDASQQSGLSVGESLTGLKDFVTDDLPNLGSSFSHVPDIALKKILGEKKYERIAKVAQDGEDVEALLGADRISELSADVPLEEQESLIDSLHIVLAPVLLRAQADRFDEPGFKLTSYLKRASDLQMYCRDEREQLALRKLSELSKVDAYFVSWQRYVIDLIGSLKGDKSIVEKFRQSALEVKSLYDSDAEDELQGLEAAAMDRVFSNVDEGESLDDNPRLADDLRANLSMVLLRMVKGGYELESLTFDSFVAELRSAELNGLEKKAAETFLRLKRDAQLSKLFDEIVAEVQAALAEDVADEALEPREWPQSADELGSKVSSFLLLMGALGFGGMIWSMFRRKNKKNYKGLLAGSGVLALLGLGGALGKDQIGSFMAKRGVTLSDTAVGDAAQHMINFEFDKAWKSFRLESQKDSYNYYSRMLDVDKEVIVNYENTTLEKLSKLSGGAQNFVGGKIADQFTGAGFGMSGFVMEMVPGMDQLQIISGRQRLRDFLEDFVKEEGMKKKKAYSMTVKDLLDLAYAKELKHAAKQKVVEGSE